MSCNSSWQIFDKPDDVDVKGFVGAVTEMLTSRAMVGVPQRIFVTWLYGFPRSWMR